MFKCTSVSKLNNSNDDVLGSDDVRQRDLGHSEDPGGAAAHGQHQVQGEGDRQPGRHGHPGPLQRGAGRRHPRRGQAVPGGRAHLPHHLRSGEM